MNFQSKELKEPKETFLDSLKCGILSDIYYFFESLYRKLKRSFSYAKFGYTNYDYEASFIYPLIAFKLKRVKECLARGYAVQEQVDLDALDEVVAICDRLSNEDYEAKYMIEHDLKWGDIEFIFKPNFESYRKNRNTQEEKEQEWKEHLAIMHKADDDRKKDIDRLCEIMKKNLPCLWD